MRRERAGNFAARQHNVPLMDVKKKVVFFILCVGAIASVLALFVFTFTLDINSYKPRIEAAASAATGMDVRINGKIGLSFFPFGLSAKDIHLANDGGEIISLENLNLGAELMPLLKKQLKVISCELVKPSITIVKNADGKYNFERTEKKSTKEQPVATISLNNLKLSKGALVYIDKKTGEKIEVKDFNLAIKDLSAQDSSVVTLKNISFTGKLGCKELQKKQLKINNVKSFIKADKGVI